MHLSYRPYIQSYESKIQTNNFSLLVQYSNELADIAGEAERSIKNDPNEVIFVCRQCDRLRLEIHRKLVQLGIADSQSLPYSLTALYLA